jgi:hypothetical protein
LISCFLFFGGADLRCGEFMIDSRAAEKQKTNVGVDEAVYKQATPTEFWRVCKEADLSCG